jgi:peptide/nickel transport system permease protein
MTMGIAATVGWTLGVLCGFLGGTLDWVVQRVTELMLGIPALILALALVTTLGQSKADLAAAMAIAFIPTIFRVVRSQALVVSRADYVAAAVVLGTSRIRIIVRHVLPHTAPAFLVVATSYFGTALLLEASLSFLGLGIAPPTPTWGQMIGTSAAYAVSAPWLVIGPGATLSVTVFLITLLGDGVRDQLDPRTHE